MVTQSHSKKQAKSLHRQHSQNTAPMLQTICALPINILHMAELWMMRMCCYGVSRGCVYLWLMYRIHLLWFIFQIQILFKKNQ